MRQSVLKIGQFLPYFLIITAFLVTSISIKILVYITLILYIAVVHGDFIYRSYLTLNRDLTGLWLLLSVRFDLNYHLRQNKGLHKIFLNIVKKNLNKIAIIDIGSDKKWTFKELNERSNLYANFFLSKGYCKGDVVAIFIENSGEFVAAWIGLAKIGVISAWINTNLKLEPLAHCINSSNCKSIITTKKLLPVLEETMKHELLNDTISTNIYVNGSVESKILPVMDISSVFNDFNVSEPETEQEIDFKSVLCFIYTSGTTGMPKAAVMKHYRYYSMVMGSKKSFGIKDSDRIYISMPMYHTAAGIIGIGQVICMGNSCAIRERFSASNFWKDCVNYNCTASQYIGEICRYLLAQPKSDYEDKHKMHLMYGNGLRSEVWEQFVNRFHVRIGELYGSTEGTTNLVNIDGHVGACGFLPISPLTSRMHPVRLIKVDETTLDVIRGKDGLCIPCKPGETGAMVSTIKQSNPLLIFEGYLNKSETNKKVLTDVFKKGDSVFLSGDILHWDRLGYVYFKDRTGDTFRWKSENVSTTEVEAVLHPQEDVADATVYGVHVPGTEGKAGMAAVVKKCTSKLNDEEFVQQLSDRLSRSLASYAIPQFIRICKALDITATYKLMKTNLQKMGYSLTAEPEDKIFIYNSKEKKYITLTEEIYEQIQNKKIQL
ncbi:Long-chain fatty acid transport protein 4 [Strongyloides ratti]|uniref:Very long-chain fatty acid transport protein n=1 Tax=Strongyloides ratti TaxID=34506 RepID=A0A090LSR1_STRRB|nr:Long-chain fatty acid transport protein 4 [Strongyloides ratti]CEF71222.1 Long-chain fatty acid transport protein 4 [Strongyloides ratti]